MILTITYFAIGVLCALLIAIAHKAEQRRQDARLLVKIVILWPIPFARGCSELKREIAAAWRDQSGQSVVEYSLLLVMIAAGVIGVLSLISGAISQIIAKFTTTLTGF